MATAKPSIITFRIDDNTLPSYTSGSIFLDTVFNRAFLYQTVCPSGATILLVGRISEDYPFHELLLSEGVNSVQEVVCVPEVRIIVTNPTGLPCYAGVSI